MRLIIMACAVIGLFGSSAALAQQPEDVKAKTAKQLSTFAYPGSKEFENYNTSGLIAQANYSTDDDLTSEVA